MSASLGKDLIGLEPLSREQIQLILDTAEPFKEVSERAIKKVPALRGKTIVNLFFENSTRTRISFEFAEKRLSADTVNVAAAGSSVQTARSRAGARAATIAAASLSASTARQATTRLSPTTPGSASARAAAPSGLWAASR